MTAYENQVVFLIQSYQGPEEKLIKRNWSNTVRNSVLKILLHLEGNNLLSQRWQNHSGFPDQHGVSWSYRFIKDKCSKVCFNKQEFKAFNIEEFQIFEEEIKYFLDDTATTNYTKPQTKNGLIDGGAHVLAEELMSMVHDYTWDRNQILSPVRVLKKSKLKNFPSKRLNRNYSSGSTNSQVIKSTEQPKGQNYIFVLSPIPQSQKELDDYFEWHVDSVNFIKLKLMPPHLSSHFCDRHKIRLFWLETNFQASTEPVSDYVGEDFMQNFLLSIEGNIIKKNMITDVIPMSNGYQSNQLISVSNVLDYLFAYKKPSQNNFKSVPLCLPVDPKTSIIIAQLNIKISQTKSENKNELEKLCTENSPCRNCKEKNNLSTYINITGFYAKHELNTEHFKNGKNSQFTFSEMEIINGNHAKYCSHMIKNKTPCAFVIISQCLRCGIQHELTQPTLHPYTIVYLASKNLAVLLSFQSQLKVTLSRQLNLLLDSAQPTLDSDNTITQLSYHMSEKWYTCCESKLSIFRSKSKMKGKNKSRKDMLQSLRNHYKEVAQNNSAKKSKRESTESISTIKTNTVQGSDFSSEHNMIETLKSDYQKLLNSEPEGNFITQSVDSTAALLKTAQSISTVVTQRCKNATPNGLHWKKKADAIIRKNFIETVEKLRKKKLNESIAIVTNECILQIILRFELATLKSSDICQDSEDISSILRLFSLCTSPVAMSNVLNNVFLDHYLVECGQLLHDVYNDLMQPLPPQLNVYSQEADDTFAQIDSVKSVSSIRSLAASSNPPSCSSGPGSSGIRRLSMVRNPSFNGPLISRQIAIPGKTISRHNSVDQKLSTEGIKDRLRNSAKKVKNIMSKNGINKKDEQARVCRDLFSNMPSNQSPKKETLSRRKSLVLDTPDAKQKYTALRRQKLREMRESRRSGGMNTSISIVEESPCKDEVRRSPRHNVMLKRRASFYKPKHESRSVARAQIIHQYNQGVVATPKAIKSRPSLSSGLLFSNKKDVTADDFGEDPFDCGEPSQPPVIPDSPAKNTRSQVSRLLFKTPQKCPPVSSPLKLPLMPNPTTSPVRSKKKNIHTNQGSMLNKDTNTNVVSDGLGILPLLPSPIKTPNKSVVKNSFVTPEKSQPLTLSASKPMKITPQHMKLPYSVTTPKFQLPEITEEKVEKRKTRTAKNIANGFDTSESVKIEDGVSPENSVFVEGIPSPTRIRSNVRLTKKRKWSTDDTPSRDDIRRWPKKKRGSDKSSPGVLSKKRKKSVGESSPDNGVIIIEDTDVFGVGKIVSAHNVNTINDISKPLQTSASQPTRFKRHSSKSIKKSSSQTHSKVSFDHVSDVFSIVVSEEPETSVDSVFSEEKDESSVFDMSNNNENCFFHDTENINPLIREKKASGSISALSLYQLHTSPIIATSKRHVHRVTRSQK